MIHIVGFMATNNKYELSLVFWLFVLIYVSWDWSLFLFIQYSICKYAVRYDTRLIWDKYNLLKIDILTVWHMIDLFFFYVPIQSQHIWGKVLPYCYLFSIYILLLFIILRFLIVPRISEIYEDFRMTLRMTSKLFIDIC